jgi:hypothetical protein
MLYHTETKFQSWRALAVFDDGTPADMQPLPLRFSGPHGMAVYATAPGPRRIAGV